MTSFTFATPDVILAASGTGTKSFVGSISAAGVFEIATYSLFIGGITIFGGRPGTLSSALDSSLISAAGANFFSSGISSGSAVPSKDELSLSSYSDSPV